MRRRWIVWLLVFSGWTALAIFFAASSSLTYALTYQPPQWRLTLVMALTEWYAWAVLTPLVAWLARRFPLRSGSMVVGLAVHTPAGLIVALVKVTLTRLTRLALVGTNAYFRSAISRRTTSSTGRLSLRCSALAYLPRRTRRGAARLATRGETR